MNTLRRALGNVRSPRTQLQILGLLAALGFVLFTVDAVSRRLGGAQITGLTSTTSTGCSCHGASPSSSTSLTTTSGSGSFVVEPGSTTTFTTSVSNSGQSAAGVAIAVKTTSTGSTNAGSLSVSNTSGLQVVNSEITHNAPKSMSSGSASFSWDWTAPTAHGSYYIQAIGNAVNNDGTNSGDLWNWMTAREVKVAGITLTSPNGGASYCIGSNVSVTWSQTAITTVKVELSSDGGTTWTTLAASVDAGATGTGSYVWTIPSSQPPGAQYRIRVSDASVATRSDVSDASFAIDGPAAITGQPSPVTVCEGSRITLSVTATGAGATYQWRRSGTSIPGATSATFTVGSSSTADAGTYDVVVTGICGAPVTSNPVTVNVNALPVITESPRSQLLCAGGSLTLRVAAQGPTLQYQWRHLGTEIAGATASTYSISNASSSDAGDYDVVVSNGDCRVTTRPAILSMAAASSITTQPSDRSVLLGAPIELAVIATGDSLHYQWRKDGAAIAGATSATYSIGASRLSDAGRYSVAVTSLCSTMVSNEVRVTVLQPGAGAVLGLSKSTIDFGAVKVGRTVSQTIESLVSNTGDSLLRITGTQLSGPDAPEFSVSGVTFPIELAPGESHAMTVSFAPTAPGARTAAIAFSSNSKTPATLALAGSAELGTLTASVAEIAFPDTRVGARSDTAIMICNTGGVEVSISQISLSPERGFTIANVPALPQTVAPGGCLTLNIAFVPTAAGAASATLALTSDASPGTTTIELSGTGTTVAAIADVQVSKHGLSVVPNPASGPITIAFEESNQSTAVIEIVDALGRTVRRLAPAMHVAGGRAVWDGRTDDGALCPDGVYRAVVRESRGVVTASFVIVR